ncbi:MAG TPA: hypothetical protein VF552_06390 [Allosphingosinicella sp.]
MPCPEPAICGTPPLRAVRDATCRSAAVQGEIRCSFMISARPFRPRPLTACTADLRREGAAWQISRIVSGCRG